MKPSRRRYPIPADDQRRNGHERHGALEISSFQAFDEKKLIAQDIPRVKKRGGTIDGPTERPMRRGAAV